MRRYPPHARAADVALRARLRVRKEARSEPDLPVFAEQLADEGEQRSLEVGQRHVLTDDETLDLGEHRRVSEVELIAAVDAARSDQPDRRLMLFHVADLHPRRVRPQQRRRRADRGLDRRGQIQRVLHVASGMLARHVERLEVVILVFELGALDDDEAHSREDRFDAIAKDGQGMAMANRGNASAERDIHRAARRS